MVVCNFFYLWNANTLKNKVSFFKKIATLSGLNCRQNLDNILFDKKD